MNQGELEKLIDDFLAAWNTQDVDKVAACYSDPFRYIDPNTKGEIHDHDSFKRYLAKLFAAWDMKWFSKEAIALRSEGGWVFRWRAEIRRPGNEKTIEINGMDLIELDGGKIVRNEVYFDRVTLGPLMPGMGDK